MLRQILCVMVPLLSAAASSPGQATPVDEKPIPVTTCQLEADPNSYDRKLVELRGRIIYGKFDFEIDSVCKPHSGVGTWIDFGGDFFSPASAPGWNLGPFLEKSQGKDVRVRGISIPLVRDARLDKLVNDFRAMRFRMPNGAGCGYQCLFYQVTATVQGRFFSGSKGAFGFNECCHLLVITRVLKVTSRRSTVPAGGEFQCTTDRWVLSDEDRKALAQIPACSLRADSKDCYPIIAKHWGDVVNQAKSFPGSHNSMSADMTRYYYFGGNFIQPPGGKGAELAPGSVATRTVCRASTPPAPPSDHIVCDFYRQSFPQDHNASLATLASVNAGNDTWRVSDIQQVAWSTFDEARKKWGLEASPLTLEKCSHNPIPEDEDGNDQEYGSCIWLSADQMRELTVTLSKPGYLVKSAGSSKRTPWIPTEVRFFLCLRQDGR